MNCKNLHLGQQSPFVLSLCLIFAASSCIDYDYDLNKEISTEVGVLGDITLPLGTTEPILLGEMIDTSEVDMLSLINGRYVITVEDSLDVSIDALGGDEGIVIEGIEEREEIEEDISKNTDFPAFETNVSSIININQDLVKVVLNEGGILDESKDVSPDYPDEVNALKVYAPEGVAMSSVDIPVTLDNGNIDLDVDIAVTCPEEVDTISGIKFGANGVKTTIKFDISSLANCFDGFSWTTPTLKVTFPEEFILNNNSNEIIIASTICEGAEYSFDIWIKEYDKAMLPTADNTLPNINGVVQCEVIGDLENISGVTNGTLLTVAPFGLSVVSEPLSITDLDVAVSGIEIAIPEEAIGSDIVIEDVSKDIYYVDKVSFVAGTNHMQIAIDQIELPAGLSAQEGEPVSLLFPNKFFQITPSDVAVTVGGYTAFQLQASELMGSGTVNKELIIEAVELGKDYPNTNGSITFDPQIKVAASTVMLAGKLSLSDYNNYVESSNNNNIEISAVADHLEIEVAEIVTNGITVEMEEKTTAIELNEEIPAELVELYSMSFANDVQASISIEIDGLPTGEGAGDLLFDNYIISFPKFIKFANGDVNADNQLLLDQVAIGNKNEAKRLFTKTLTIEELDFTDYPDLIQLATDGGDNTLVLNESVSLSGNVKLESGSANSDLQKITGVVKFTMSDIEIARITGKVDPDMPNVNESIDLSELTEEVTLEDVSVVLTNPTISLNVSNPLAIPVEISTLKLVPYKDGAAKAPIQTLETIVIAGGDDATDTPAITNINLWAEASDDTHYQVEGLGRLLEDLPDSIQIEVASAVGGDKHSIDVTKEYNLKFDYAVNVPLAFEEFNIAYSDTITGLGESLEEVVDMVLTIELILEVTNALPFTIDIAELTPLDVDGNVLGLQDFFPEESAIKGGSTDAPAVSKITLRIANNEAKELALLDALAIKVAANVASTNGGVALSEEQYVKLGLKVRLPEGLTFDYEEDLN